MEEGTTYYENQQVKAPILSIIPIPSLMIDRVTVDFQVEVKTTIENSDRYNKSTEDTSKRIKIFSPGKTEMIGKVTEQRENTRTTSKGAKYNFKVLARMQDKPEGLHKILDLIVAQMTP